MADIIGRTRIALRSGTNYLAVEDIDHVVRALEGDRYAEFTSVTGQDAFPPERLVILVSEIASVQECSLESWIWNQRASELHYARQLEEVTAQDRMVSAFERIAGEGDDD
jgi:hypothetical protein